MTESNLPQSNENRRRHERYLCKLKITYTVIEANDSTPIEYHVAHSKDFSESGICIYTEHRLEAPVLVQLNITIPVRPFHLLILGKALWCEEASGEDGLYEAGIKFVGILPPDFHNLVNEFGSTLWSSQ